MYFREFQFSSDFEFLHVCFNKEFLSEKIHLNLMQCCCTHAVAKNITIKAGKSFKSQRKKMGKWELQKKISAFSKFFNRHETFYSQNVDCFMLYRHILWNALGLWMLLFGGVQILEDMHQPSNQPSAPSSLVPVLLR